MINLLSPEIKSARMYGRRNRSLLGYCLILFMTAIGIMTIMAGSLQFVGVDEAKLNSDIENSNVEILALEQNVKSIETVADRLEKANKISELSVKFSEIIPEIGALLPEGVVLNALSLAGGFTDPLILDVSLASADLGPILIRNLVESELFEAADIATISPKSTGEAGVEGQPVAYSFSASLTASFTGTAEAKRKVAAAEAAKKAAAEEAATNAAKESSR